MNYLIRFKWLTCNATKCATESKTTIIIIIDSKCITCIYIFKKTSMNVRRMEYIGTATSFNVISCSKYHFHVRNNFATQKNLFNWMSCFVHSDTKKKKKFKVNNCYMLYVCSLSAQRKCAPIGVCNWIEQITQFSSVNQSAASRYSVHKIELMHSSILSLTAIRCSFVHCAFNFHALVLLKVITSNKLNVHFIPTATWLICWLGYILRNI